MLDDDSLAATAGAHPDLGVVEVQIFRVLSLGRAGMDQLSFGRVAEVGPVHERSKKAGAHCVAYVVPCLISC